MDKGYEAASQSSRNPTNRMSCHMRPVHTSLLLPRLWQDQADDAPLLNHHATTNTGFITHTHL